MSGYYGGGGGTYNAAVSNSYSGGTTDNNTGTTSGGTYKGNGYASGGSGGGSGLGGLGGGLTKAAGAAVGIGANLLGASQANGMLGKAANTITNYANQGLGSINAGAVNYANTIKPLLTPNPIVLPTYRDQTAQQQIGEQDLIRNGQAQLAADGLRGAGRAGVGAVLDQDQRYQAANRAANDSADRTAMQTAQGISDAAIQKLADNKAQTAGSLANIDTSTGYNLSNLYKQQGTNTGNATTSSGGLISQAIGALGSIFG